MKTENELPDLKLEKTPFGKVIGIVESRDQLQAVTAALSLRIGPKRLLPTAR